MLEVEKLMRFAKAFLLCLQILNILIELVTLKLKAADLLCGFAALSFKCRLEDVTFGTKTC